MKRLVLLSCAVACAWAPWMLCAGENLEALIDKVAAAYGGRASLEQIVAVRQTGRVEPATQSGKPGPISRTFARPLKLRVEVGDPAKPNEVRILNGASGWRNGKESNSGMGYEAMMLQAARLDLPFQLMSHRKELTEKDPEELQGKRLRVVQVPVEHGLSILAGIEPKTGHILFSKGTTSAGPSGPTMFETRYEDFRKTDGLLFAFKEINFAGDTKTAETMLSKIELLKSSPEEAFKP